MTTINLYRVTISQAYRMSETGDHFTDNPENYRDRNYAIDTPDTPERVLTLADGVESYEAAFGDTALVHPDGTQRLLSEILTPEGHVIDAKWGTTKAIR
jgi:hypothetical protein